MRDRTNPQKIDAPGLEPPRIARARTGSEFAIARGLFEEYAARLGVDLCLQGFSAELTRLDAMYAPPAGCLLLAWLGDEAVGCAGLRRLSASVCEMKRLYVRDRVRGRGFGRQLAAQLLAQARELGYRSMVLDTLAGMREARGLYESLGFRACGPYYENPLPGVVYMGLDLGPAARQPP
jgi:putative acetyltransferase